MHYRNGREAKNGDKIIGMLSGSIDAVGILRDATPDNDYCNGYIQVGPSPSASDPVACLCDCLLVEDVMALLAEKGLDKRPEGK